MVRGESNASCLHKIRRTSATAIPMRHGLRTGRGHARPPIADDTERYVDPSTLPKQDFSKVPLPRLGTLAG